MSAPTITVRSSIAPSILLLVASAASAAPVGSEFLVKEGASTPSVAASPGDGFAVVWRAGSNVQMQRFDAADQAVGPEIAVGQACWSTSDQEAIATTQDGTAIVVHPGLVPEVGCQTHVSRFDASGTALGTPYVFPLVPYEGFPELTAAVDSSVAANASGEFVVAAIRITGYGLSSFPSVQRFAVDGAPLGAEVLPYDPLEGGLTVPDAPTVGLGEQGEFVVTWASYSYEEATARGFDGANAPAGPAFDPSAGIELARAVTAGADGTFLIQWVALTTDVATRLARGRVFEEDGTPVAPEVTLGSVLPQNGTESPRAAADPSGAGYLSVWSTEESVGDDADGASVQGQYLDPAGQPVGAAFQVNVGTTGAQRKAQVAFTGGGFVALWESRLGGSREVLGRRFDPACLDADGDGYGAIGYESRPAGPATDCNDLDAAVNPGASEIPRNGIDDDCNPETPMGCAPELASAAVARTDGSRTDSPLDLVALAASILGVWNLRRRVRRA